MAVFTADFKKTFPWAVLFLALVGVIVFQWIGANGDATKRLVSVVGECNGRVEKDTTSITLRIQTLAPTGAESMAAARNTYNVVAAMLGQFEGLDKQTSRWDSYERTEWDSAANRQVTRGIETVISLDVSSKNAADIEDVMARAEGVENVFPENLRMSVSSEKMRPAIEACINDAVQNARAKAETIADSEGAQVGEMIAAEYGTAGRDMLSRPMMLKTAIAMDSVEMAGGAGLFATDAEFSVTITATFRLK